MDFTYQEAKDLLEVFGGNKETEISAIEVKEGEPNHTAPGLYAFPSEYPDAGSMLLGSGRGPVQSPLRLPSRPTAAHNYMSCAS